MKHAYLIMAHNNRMQLEQLLIALDHDMNDIYLHIDIKSSIFDDYFSDDKPFDFLQNSHCYLVPRTNIQWGGYSQINAEILLLKTALSTGDYLRFHLLSGVDLPIKTQEFIHDFFDSNQNKEFVHFDYEQKRSVIESRMSQYHLLINKIGRRKSILQWFEKLSRAFQKAIGINRIRNDGVEYKKGANWFSITRDLARFVVDHEPLIKKKFKMTKCCDEVFLQTLVYNSHFKDFLYFDQGQNRYHNMRYIDWTRGNPYVFQSGDYEELMQSPDLFARKFDENIDIQIIKRIVSYLKKVNQSI